jgi:hypothetical protein
MNRKADGNRAKVNERRTNDPDVGSFGLSRLRTVASEGIATHARPPRAHNIYRSRTARPRRGVVAGDLLIGRDS